ncbi:MAG: DUF3500 domain-containing protein [Roseiflexaceae bacterium]
MTTDLLLPQPASLTARRMAEAASALLESLGSDQRVQASFPFQGDERYQWSYTPGVRNGLPLQAMTPAQRRAALRLFDAGLSTRGAVTAQEIIAHESILRETERIEQRHSVDDRDPELFYFSVFGRPGGAEPWGWRANGHHLALNFAVVGDALVSPTPLFFGANPAEVHHGPERGMRILAAEEDMARVLLGSLAAEQISLAVVDPVAPDDILTKNYRMADPLAISRGIAYAGLSGAQRGHLVGLVRHYIERTAEELSAQIWARIERAGLDEVTFAWAGSAERGQGHYYAVKGPTFLIEYDNTQNQANHIHSVWRDFTHDWDEDVLAQHYAHSHAAS